MTTFNSPQIPLLNQNATVKAWCLTSNHQSAAATTQPLFDALNFVDGYNLRISRDSVSYASNTSWGGALKFSFLTPMANSKYKVFASCVSQDSLSPMIATVLNSSTYPKTPNSFWIRLSFVHRPVGGTSNALAVTAGRTQNQMATIRLWDNFLASLSVVVL